MAFIGLLSGILGIYTFIIQDKTLQIEYEILANTNVLDINADITKLDIIYDGSSLKTNNQSLRLINLRIRNTGNQSILKSFYDTNDPLGISILNGKIIEKPEIIGTSSDYITKNLVVNYDTTGKLFFNDLIIEPNEFYSVKLLILHNSNQTPEILSVGKIASIKEIPIVSLTQQAKKEMSFWIITYGGNILSQLLRALSYSVVVIIIIALIAASIENISSSKKKHKRNRLIRQFKELDSYTFNRMDDAIFTRFKDSDLPNLLRYSNLLKDENRLNQKYNNWVNKLKKNVEDEILENEIASKELQLNDTFFTHRSEWIIINEMISDGFIIKDKDKLLINQPMKRSLNQFIDYLKEIKYFDPNKPKVPYATRIELDAEK